MNENLNLIEILKDCPKGTKLYSPIYGDVELEKVFQGKIYPIQIKLNNNSTDDFTKEGIIFREFNGECMLFPSKNQRDWSKFKPKKPKFDPKTLQAFDKVLAKDRGNYNWICEIFSHINTGNAHLKYWCIGSGFEYCIPYNDDTKHLVGTSDEAPEFYRYWED